MSAERTGRREWIRAIGVAGAGLAAGCLGSGEEHGPDANETGTETGDSSDDRSGEDEQSEPNAESDGHSGQSWPTFAGDRANTGGRDVDGPVDEPAVAWTVDLGDVDDPEPIVYEDTVYVSVVDSDRPGDIIALDASNGDRHWIAERSGSNRYDAALLAANRSLVTATDKFAVLEPETGKERWSIGVDSARTGFAMADGVVCYGSGSTLIAIDLERRAERWRVDLDGLAVTPATDGEAVYVGSRGADLQAFDLADGTERWRFESDNGFWTPPVVYDGRVHAAEDYRVRTLDAATGDLEWSDSYGSVVYVPPVVVDDSVYATNGVDLRRYDAATGDRTWAREVRKTGSFMCPFAANEETLWTASSGGDVLSFDAETGDQRWRTRITDGFVGAPAVADGMCFLTRRDGTLCAVREE